MKFHHFTNLVLFSVFSQGQDEGTVYDDSILLTCVFHSS